MITIDNVSESILTVKYLVELVIVDDVEVEVVFGILREDEDILVLLLVPRDLNDLLILDVEFVLLLSTRNDLAFLAVVVDQAFHVAVDGAVREDGCDLDFVLLVLLLLGLDHLQDLALLELDVLYPLLVLNVVQRDKRAVHHVQGCLYQHETVVYIH